jgi:hypothetical protein
MRLVPGLRRAESLNENGVVVDRLISRWIGEREAFEKAKRLPKRGDRIITEAGDEYVVSHPAGGREYEFRDPYAESISIHSLMDRIRTVDTPIVTTIRAYGNGFGKIYGSGFGQLYGSA